MPSIGDITGRVVITDAGSATVQKVGANIEAVSRTIIASMSRATLAAETSIRNINASLAKLKTKIEPTETAKGLVSDLDALIKKRQQEITALKAGPAAIAALNQKRYEEAQALKIAAAQVDAGVSAESHLGRVIASNIKTLDRYEKEIDDIARAQAEAVKKTEQQIAAYRKLSDTGRALATHLTLPLLALGAGAVKTATDFESSFAGVRKTVDATEEEFVALSTQIRELAAGKDAIPIDVNKLNAVAEAAGQLGIQKSNIIAFTRAMADLGETTNLTADEAATATAQFQNIFGAAGKEVDRFGSTLVALGNAGASTERDIISMGLRIAGAGVQIGLSQGEVLAYASSLASMGIEAEAGGSAISKVMIDIALAVSKGGKELNNFAVIAGMSVSEFRTAFREDAASAVASFIEGLGRMKASGQDVIGTLDAMGITEVRMRDALLRSAGAGDLLRNSLVLQAKAWAENTALTEEAQKRYQTFESQLRIFWNQLKDVAITFGTTLLPALRDALEAGKPWIENLAAMAEWFARLDPAGQKVIIMIAGLAAAAGPAVFVTGQLLLAWSQIVQFAPKVVTALRSVAAATQGLVVVGVLLFINELIKAWGRAEEAVTRYNLEVAKIEGVSLDFVKKVEQGLGSITADTFDARLRDAERLKEAIIKANAELDKMTMGGRLSEEDIKFSGIQPFKDFKQKQAELENLWRVYGKLRTALAGVAVEGEKVDDTLGGDKNPFAGLLLGGEKASDIIADLNAELIRQTQALELLRDGVPVERIENLVESARELEKTDLLDPLVLKAGLIKDKIDDIANAFKLAEAAKKAFAEAGDDLHEFIGKQFEKFAGENDPAWQRLVKELKEAKDLTDSIKTDEQKRLETIGRAAALYDKGLITAAALQKVMIDNATQFTIVLDKVQVTAERLYEQFEVYANDLAFSLVSNWRRAWEENESITDATIDTLRDAFLNVLQDVISQWLSAWFRAMAAWLARWIATQAAAKGAQAGLGSVSGGGGAGSVAGVAGAAGGSGVSAGTLAGWATAAFALYVIYKGFVEDHKRKFARVEIVDGRWDMTAWHGKKYMAGVQQAAEMIVNNLQEFLGEIDVEMTRLGTVIVESSKAGWNVSIPGSTGKLFKSMEEAIAYAQVLMLKYGEFADSVSLLVRSVIKNTQAISLEDLAADIAFAKELETQNLEQSAVDVQRAMDLAIAQWKRAEDLFLSLGQWDLPAFAEAALSILTKLGNSLWTIYNQLAGIEEDPEKAWQRQKAAYNAQRLLVLAQLKLWALEIDARIKNLQASGHWLGGLGGVTRGTLNLASAMVQAAEILDPALQSLLDIQALINKAIEETPPELKDEDYPGKKGRKGGGRGRERRDLREDLRDEIAGLEAEAKGPLHSAFFELTQNIEAFRERAKEAKLPAAELAKGVELLTAAFQRSVREQARAYAGLETEISRRLHEINAFFDELEALGFEKTGISNEELAGLRSQALARVGQELAAMIAQFAGLVDPMLAINMRAQELRDSVIAYGEAAGWSAQQIEDAINQIEQGIEFQRLQGINSVLGNLFNILKQAGLYQEEALELERQSTLLQLQIIEAQLRFYGALDARAQEWIDAAREFVNSPAFGDNDNLGTGNDVVAVRVVEGNWTTWDDIADRIASLVEDWRQGVKQFAESTEALLTDENLTNLTQAQQLEFARSRLDELASRAQAGDLEALTELEGARAEYLRELRESEGAGFGFDKGWDWAMDLTADVLKNAQAAEQQLIANELAKNVEAWSYVMGKLGERLEAAFYSNTQDLINAIYSAIAGVPSFASGGVVMSGPRLVRVAEYVPEAIVPLDRLANMVPYPSRAIMNSYQGWSNPMGGNNHSLAMGARSDFEARETLARLSSVEATNTQIAQALNSIKTDIATMARRR